MATKGKRYLLYISQNYSYAMLRPIQEEIIREGGEVRWFLEGNEVDAKYLTDAEHQVMTIDALNKYKPHVVFVPGNVVPSFIPGIKVGVFHGFDSGKREGKHYAIRGSFDLYCTQGPQTTEPFLKLASQYGFFTVEETGWAALDPLFSSLEDNQYVEQGGHRPTVLMCSTFTKNLSCAPHVYEEVKRLSQDSKWRWLIQFHPKMSDEWVKKYKSLENENLTFVETDNVIPLLQAADVMLCDTSSVLLMFLLQQKPVVTFRNQNPMHHIHNIENSNDVEQAIEYVLSKPEPLMGNIADYSAFIHPYQDGQSSKRVLDASNELVESGLKALKSKPLNLIRNFKLRTRLGYWRWW
ncbi:CDP-glycerol glycerophosphotransferase family protein [Vibrio lentus]|uniref:CDP-glycerol--glycerophosphate glycerophosphotransferase n=1 Tax=Vibrio lentus TaxID=136468 RepID=A0A2N7BJY5_9VIBR|nr:CDP-glycerol glycerophosphotransferase family protein [Vibrio lentus]PME46653.1 CDP-glycerol--glycerophosphate glycerophosphotransferase [Vibrio lentus]PME56932.1 CDP-glycerol--glycerophosphate glycerophosphotransferase [Vibrio lentus]PME82766.1 CDP-glycerol--glycerophosphate glycerophosphotransferase [Vibrio lentus]